MSDRPQDDRRVGVHGAVPDYEAGVQARTQQRVAGREQLMPNLGQAAVTYRASEGAQTLADIGAAQRSVQGDGAAPAGQGQGRGLRPETVEGLRALRAEQDAAEARRASTPAAPPAQQSKAEAAMPKEPEGRLSEDDLEFMESLRAARRDAIQNEREQDAVSKRVEPIDLAEGLLTGEFTQLVPIVPGKLTVRFRCLTTGENNELRLLLLDQVVEDKRREALVGEMLSFYQTVAMVASINQTIYPKHMTPSGAFGALAFSKAIFEQKLATFLTFPLPLIASLGTHASWFEMRVRELFVTADTIKNG